MSLNAKSIRKPSLLGALVLASAFVAQAADATPTAVPADAYASVQAVTITKQHAVAIALQAVGGGTVVLVLLERDNGSLHWSIDIIGATAEHEVWVSTQGKVLKIITQPL